MSFRALNPKPAIMSILHVGGSQVLGFGFTVQDNLGFGFQV